MGCASCGKKYRGVGATRSRMRFQRVGSRRIAVKVDEPKAPESVGVTVQAQQEAPIAVPEFTEAVDHSTGIAIAVIKEGGAGEMQVPNTLPQPEPVVVETVPNPSQE